MTLNRRQAMFTISAVALAPLLSPLMHSATGKVPVPKEVWITFINFDGSEVTPRVHMKVNEAGHIINEKEITFMWEKPRTPINSLILGIAYSEAGPIAFTSTIDVSAYMVGPGDTVKIEGLTLLSSEA